MYTNHLSGMLAGYQNSRFAHQIERYACLYTSHISNLAYYSPDKRYQGRCDVMAHEQTAWGLDSGCSAEAPDIDAF